MNYYIIKLTPLIGDFYFENRKNEIVNIEVLNIEKSPLVIYFQTDYSERILLEESGNFIVNKEAKSKLEESNLSGLNFRVIDKIIRQFRVDDDPENVETTDDDYWLLLPPLFNRSDFNKFRTNLIVSEEALQFLFENEFFQEMIEGKVYGKEFEVLTNRFLIEGEVEDFVFNKLPKHREQIDQMRKKIHAEIRRREGLPPLP